MMGDACWSKIFESEDRRMQIETEEEKRREEVGL